MADDLIEILLVEDNEDDEELTLLALNEVNLVNHIQVARDGVEALDFIFSTGAFAHRGFDNMPKLILLDLKIPKIDGIEVLRRIKADPRTRMIPVVVLTSSREERDVIDTYQLGVNSYITKPVDFEQFMQSVRQIGMYWGILNQPPNL